ncbi:hypothetical protein FUAX_29230 [Fulvitalea axinellae]|uniref:Uncharacterized protein n=1 Tax=Fulvitalea axinellae TaxID=1182444 RepID=A0AAU9CEE4_9BACT|nr:hypothetical protein FUAX_29230 [Fulvitalea axinellae]
MEGRTTGEAEKFLGQLGRKMDELLDKAKEQENGARERVDSTIRDLKKSRETFERDIERIKKESSSDQEFETKVGASLNDLKEAFGKIADRHFPPKKPTDNGQNKSTESEQSNSTDSGECSAP